MMDSDNLRPADRAAAQPMIEALEAAGYRIVPPAQSLDDALRSRMEGLARDLSVIGGMTRRGAVLPEDYRDTTLQSMRRALDRLFDALDKGEPVEHPWDHKETSTCR